MTMNFKILASLFALGIVPSVPAEICKRWEVPTQIGSLPNSLIHEASGLAISARFPNRLYHINDSTNGPYLYTTDSQGERVRKIEISGFKSDDTEDLSVAPCGKDSCLYIADTGDNNKLRQEVEIVVIKEPTTLESKLTPTHHVRLDSRVVGSLITTISTS